MNRKKFVYKISDVDGLIFGVILFTIVVFGAIIVSDYVYNQNAVNPTNNTQFQELIKERDRLEKELERYKNEPGVKVEDVSIQLDDGTTIVPQTDPAL